MQWQEAQYSWCIDGVSLVKGSGGEVKGGRPNVRKLSLEVRLDLDAQGTGMLRH